MHDPIHIVLPLAVLLAAGVFSTALLPKLGIPAILGYLLAGVIVGPSVTGWVPMSEAVQMLAEFGVVFLLFDIGLHFSLKQLWASKKDFLVLGPLQSLSSIAVIGAALWYLDLTPLSTVVLVAGALALSSTAVALQTLADRNERDTPLGQSATALLIFQDIVAVVLLALVSAGGDGAERSSSFTEATIMAVLAIAAVAIIGRLLRPAFAWIVKEGLDEAFTAFALLVVVVTASLTGLAGLSLPLGAFLGGMLLSESEYCYMIKTELKPFRGLLIGLFFITVGMSLETDVVADSLGLTLAIAGGLLLSKAVLIVLSARATGASWALSTRLGFTLSQGSEFAFVILSIMIATAALEPGLGAMLMAAVVITMALTPVLAPLGDKVGSSMALRELGRDVNADPEVRNVLINGAGERELVVASALMDNGHEYLAIDQSTATVAKARSLGFSAGVGNLEDAQFVEGLGEHLDVLILGRTTSAESVELIKRLKKRRPSLEIIARVASSADAQEMEDLGIVVCIAETDPDNQTLAEETLRYFKVDEKEIERWAERFEKDPKWQKADKAHAAA